MFSKKLSRFRSPNNRQHHSNLIPSISFNICQIIKLIERPLPLFYYILSMSMFYQVMGAVRCPKIKKHQGIKLRPINKAKDPFMPNDMIIYTCESTEDTQTIKCLDDGRWSDLPYCPDPVNNTCPELGTIEHGTYNSSGSTFKVGTVLSFRCENELLPNVNQSNIYPAATTTTSMAATTTTASMLQTDKHSQLQQTISENSETASLKYNLTGHRLLKCLPSSKWNHPVPTCTPIIPEPPSNVGFVLTSAILILIPILIMVTMFHLFMRWRKRQQQRERWKQYFTDYKYRHSKTSITFGTRPSPNNIIPVTDL